MRKAPTIVALQLFLLLAAIDQTVITTAMPRIIDELGGFDRYSWATTGYLFSSTIAVPVAGRLSDLYGRKSSLLVAVLVFVVASLACGAAVNLPGVPIDGMAQLIVYRILQGIGGGALVSLAFSVVADMFSPAERGRYQGYFAAVFAFASIVGPALGGYVADVFSWRWLFFVNLPIGLIGTAIFNRSFQLPQPQEKPKEEEASHTAGKNLSVVASNNPDSIDWKGLVLFCFSSLALLVALSLPLAGRMWVNAASAFLFLLLGWLFIKVEKTARSPFLPIQQISSKIIFISIISLAIYGVGMFGASLLVPLYMQSVRGLSVSRSGLMLSPLILTVALSSILGGQWMSRTGKYKVIVLTGLILMSVSVLILSSFSATTSLVTVISCMVVAAMGIGLLLPVYTVVIQNAVSDDMTGTVTGLSQFSRSMGGTLGVACLGSLLIFFYSGNLSEKQSLRSLPPSAMMLLKNPIEPSKLKPAIEAAVLPTKSELHADSVIEEVVDSLYSSMQIIYRIYGAMLIFAVLLNLLLEELPLRSTKSETSPETLVPSQTN
ncbi:MAG TPA: MDR family MFS transporter [Oculatellaceae cyanobacterium]